MEFIGWSLFALVLIAVAIVVAAGFYERATNEVSLLRTGVGGRRVVIDGGVLAVPYFHEISRVNMQTLRLDVDRRGESSLITLDRLRVDVGAEFYVSVIADADAIIRAAQTLGNRTFQGEELRALIDGMMVDALRAVAAKMTLDQLHENRAEFVGQVGAMLKETLERYGLQLLNVSLTALDQTPFASLDENNAFNAVGMRKLAEVVANSRKERAQIDADSEVSVRRAAMEAARQRLDIDLEERRAEIAQQQEIETLAAAQLAEVAQRKADSERVTAEARIQMELQIEEAEIARQQTLSLAEQDRAIAISAKSQQEAQAKIEADAAQADAVQASEAVETARAQAVAERQSHIARIQAESQARAAAAKAEIAAQNQRAIAKDQADAVREAADAQRAAEMAQAEARRARLEAENTRSDALIAMELEKARLEAMPKIVGEMVKPAEKIKAINVNHVTGLARAGEGSEPKGAVGAALDSIMDMAVQLPVLKKIGDQLGVSLDAVTDTSSRDQDPD